jgi:hypothetical protein
VAPLVWQTRCIVALMSEPARIAGSSKPIPYELRQSVAAAAEYAGTRSV